MRRRFRPSAMQLALLALLLSAALQFAAFATSPRDPMNDVDYSIFAAQNLLAHGELKGLNLLSDFGDDLAPFAQRRWMVHYPPGHSLAYAAVMSLGLNPSDATKALALIGMLAGGIGWIGLARFLRASPGCMLLLAALYPWLPWVANAYRLYETEYVTFAIMPWLCLALLRIAPIAETQGMRHPPPPNQTGRLALAILLSLLMVWFKYSMVPVFLAAGLYLIWQDGRRFPGRPVAWQGAVAGLLSFPVILALLVSTLYGPRVLRDGVAAQRFQPQALLRNLLDNSVAATLGWPEIVRRAPALFHAAPAAGLITFMSLATLGVWIAYLRRDPPRDSMRSFGVLLLLMTISLWASLMASTFLGSEQWNFTADPRFYMPITLMGLLFCAVSLDRMAVGARLRSPALYGLALPIALTVIIGGRTAWYQRPDPAMPASGIAWKASRDPRHAAFLARFASAHGHKPDLLIAMPSMMNELRVASFATGYLVPPGHHYWSSRPLELWALVLPSQEKALLDNSAGAEIRRVATPAGYPFAFYIIRFEADAGQRKRSPRSAD